MSKFFLPGTAWPLKSMRVTPVSGIHTSDPAFFLPATERRD
jgi:hypothetical protein